MEGSNAERCQVVVSSGVNAVEIVVEQLFRGFVSQNLSRQTVDTVGEETDIFCGIVRYTLAFWNEPPQHMVVALICAFLEGGIRMCEVYLQTSVGYVQNFL